MDLVEIQPNGDPPVCRIMDYGKFKFEAAEEGPGGQEEAASRSKSRK